MANSQDIKVTASGTVVGPSSASESAGIQSVTFSCDSGRSIKVQASKKSDMAMIYRIPVLGWIARRVMGLFEIRVESGQSYLVKAKHAIRQLMEKDTGVNAEVQQGTRISKIMLNYLNSKGSAEPAVASAHDEPAVNRDYNLTESNPSSKTKQALGTLMVRLGFGNPFIKTTVELLAKAVREGRDIALGGEESLDRVPPFNNKQEAMSRLNSLIDFVKQHSETGFEYVVSEGTQILLPAQINSVLGLLNEVKERVSKS